MQNDLIRRSALLEIFNHDLKGFETDGKTEEEMYISVADMRRMIEGQPTAYDIENVVEEVRKYDHRCDNCETLCNCSECDFVRLIDAIRKGGVDNATN